MKRSRRPDNHARCAHLQRVCGWDLFTILHRFKDVLLGILLQLKTIIREEVSTLISVKDSLSLRFVLNSKAESLIATIVRSSILNITRPAIALVHSIKTLIADGGDDPRVRPAAQIDQSNQV